MEKLSSNAKRILAEHQFRLTHINCREPVKNELREMRTKFILALVSVCKFPVEIYLYIIQFLLPGEFYNRRDLQILFERYPGVVKIDLSGAILDGMNLSETNFRGVNFSYASMNRVNFRDTNIHSCNFHFTELHDCNWQGVIFVGSIAWAYISGGIFRYSDFFRSDLKFLLGPEVVKESRFSEGLEPTIMRWDYEHKCWSL